ncbi:SMI1/KNR4 family protein [Streptomyces sp. NPDC127049]|uniref:SMI1/KNR4 family protein n=1 Tax=Streptomyces sp. NPDC127049 TaxID=3347118 RepID=UPI0036588506
MPGDTIEDGHGTDVGERAVRTERERTVEDLVEEFLRGAPEDWTEARLSWTEDDHGLTSTSGFRVPDGSWQLPRGRGGHRFLLAPARALRVPGGPPGGTGELVCAPGGAYRLVVAPGATVRRDPGSGGCLIVLDPDARLPEPGREEEVGTAPPAGDPAEAVALFRAITARRAALLGGPERLPAPAAESAIAEAERRLGVRLPADFRALYALADGDAVDGWHRWLLVEGGWLSLDRLVAVHEQQRGPDWTGWSLAWRAVILDADPPGRVRRCTGDPTRIPFLTGEDGNYVAVDLAPARRGRPGQVIGIGHDHAYGAAHLAESVTALLRRVLGELERGAYEVDDGNVWLDSSLRGAARPPSPGTVEEPPGPRTQEVLHHAEDGGPVDLAALAGAPALRQVGLHGGAAARDLAPLRETPVESLTTAVTGTALAPLAGHPRLRALHLTGADAPVDLAPLRTVPGLCGLDLSAVPLADPAVLAELTGLRYLALDRDQWAALLRAGGPTAGLAAALLVGPNASLDEALALAARLGRPLEAYRAESAGPASARGGEQSATPRSPGTPAPT